MKRKLKNKLEQLEKSFSELAKDVAELKQKENALITASEHTKNLEVDFENVETKNVSGWHKDDRYPKWLMYIDFENKKFFGFDSNRYWLDRSFIYKYKLNKAEYPATHSEVEQALIEEAKKRGLVNGAKIKNHQGEFILDYEEIIYSSEPNNGIWAKQREGIWLFMNGVWATILEETPIKEEDVIDWSKPQLFIGKTTKCIVMSNGKTGIESFEANLVALPEGEISSYYKIPNYFNDCSKKDYELFKGTLTINKE